MDSNLSGLVELVLVVGLLVWFWHSQTAVTRKRNDSAPNAGGESTPPKDPPGAPR